MTSRRSFYLKIAYLVVIGVLLLPLSFLSQPASSRAKEGGGGPGGILARLRAKHDLSQAQLGEIDPTSETIKLATFGLRGVATNILWEKANRYDKKKDWTNLSATLKQIAKLEPHFIAVWRFQAWRVSYNVSAEFDDYRGRYRWVIRGIDFLNEGIRYNEREPVLYWDVGWFTAQKIGRADESKQFRKLFKEDDDFHGSRPPEFRDNWLVGKEAFTEAEALVAGGSSLKKMSPVLFYSERPMCQMNYAETLEKDGSFGDKAEIAWRTAAREWHEYGNRDIPTSFGLVIRLNDRAEHVEQTLELRAELDAMTPGVREKLAQDRADQLSEEERELLDVPYDERTEQQHEHAMMIHRRLRITHEQVAEQLTGAERSKAVEVAKMLTEAEEMAKIIRRYQEIVNFEYWGRRAAIEQTEQARDARRFIYEAGQAFVEATDLGLAKEKFEQGLAKWRELLDLEQFENLVQDADLGRDLIETIDLYRKILDARDEPFPEDFILQDVLDLHEARFSEPEQERPPADE